MLRAHALLMNQAALRLVTRLTHMRQGGAVQINNVLSGMTMEVIGGAAFGYARPLSALHMVSASCQAVTLIWLHLLPYVSTHDLDRTMQTSAWLSCGHFAQAMLSYAAQWAAHSVYPACL